MSGMSFERAFKRLTNIIKAWYFVARRYDPPYAKPRREICNKCEFKKWGVCIKCGCPIHAKPRIKDEECPLGKW